VPQLIPDKPVVGGIRVDPPEEILANKLCTLLSRAEIRDIVDLRALERPGYRTEEALPAAVRKDGGLTPAQLAWVLSEIRIGDDAKPPGNVEVGTLRAHIADLVNRLTALAHPSRTP
jgi:Nucleotidyl transferase AbiEii toxin, Type IV TA system